MVGRNWTDESGPNKPGTNRVQRYIFFIIFRLQKFFFQIVEK